MISLFLSPNECSNTRKRATFHYMSVCLHVQQKKCDSCNAIWDNSYMLCTDFYWPTCEFQIKLSVLPCKREIGAMVSVRLIKQVSQMIFHCVKYIIAFCNQHIFCSLHLHYDNMDYLYQQGNGLIFANHWSIGTCAAYAIPKPFGSQSTWFKSRIIFIMGTTVIWFLRIPVGM